MTERYGKRGIQIPSPCLLSSCPPSSCLFAFSSFVYFVYFVVAFHVLRNFAGANRIMKPSNLFPIFVVLLSLVVESFGGENKPAARPLPNHPGNIFLAGEEVVVPLSARTARPGRRSITTASGWPAARCKAARPGWANSRWVITSCGKARRPRRSACWRRSRPRSPHRRRSPST